MTMAIGAGKGKATPGKPAGPKVILASVSPRRRELLKKVIPRFKVVPSGVDEDRFRGLEPNAFALEAALAKAKAVGRRHPSSLIISADTLVVLGGEVFGKPAGRDQARVMLAKLSGRTHKVITAVVLYRKDRGRVVAGLEMSRVRFKRLGRKAIEDYLDSSEYLDKAGAYAIQESGDRLVARLEGDYDNVVGLPVALLQRLMAEYRRA
jgi:septum formation protein